MLDAISLFSSLRTDRRSVVSSGCGLVFVLCVFLLPRLGFGQEIVGVERCRSCHEFEYQKWLQGPHAAARHSLTDSQLNDPKCNSCHSIKRAGGEKRGSVECESCHGPGQYYHRTYVMKDSELARAVGLVTPTKAHCEQCHTAGTPSVVPFDFEKMWKKIDHSETARLLWEKARAAYPDK